MAISNNYELRTSFVEHDDEFLAGNFDNLLLDCGTPGAQRVARVQHFQDDVRVGQHLFKFLVECFDGDVGEDAGELFVFGGGSLVLAASFFGAAHQTLKATLGHQILLLAPLLFGLNPFDLTLLFLHRLQCFHLGDDLFLERADVRNLDWLSVY
jgi:hypothetical protein